MKRYFFHIRYLSSDVDVQLLSGRCISILHGFVSKHRLNDIGVSFPEWTDSFMGRSIAFVGPDERSLAQLQQQPYFAGMSEVGFFSLSEIQLVPAELEDVRFVRNQGIAKCFSGEKRRRFKRAKLRAEERGEAFDPSQITQNRDIETFHRARLDSGSTGQRFVLHIQKQPVNGGQETGFNRYGLATNEVWKGTVPDLYMLNQKIHM